MLYFCLKLPITRSTCIRKLAISLVLYMSNGDSCVLPLLKVGTINSVARQAYTFIILKPWSSTTLSPGNNLYKSPHCRVIEMSGTLPPNDSEILLVEQSQLKI